MLKDSQKAGLLSKKIKPDHLIVSFLGVVTFYFAYSSTLEDLFQYDPLSKSAIEQRKKQVQLQLEAMMSQV